MPDRWVLLEDLFHAALERSGSERATFLDSACGDDIELRRQLEALLRSDEQASKNGLGTVVRDAANEFLGVHIAGGERVGPYRIIRLIGHGGMGAVYLAERSDDFNQRVALKIVQPGLSQSAELLLRFRAERQILANLNHPNIAKLLDGGATANGAPYLAMEYVDGVPISVFCRENALSTRDRIALIRQLCSAVQNAHQNLVVHRDLKPSNVLVTQDGTPKLLDFGIAKLLRVDLLDQTIAFTRAAERLMTPEYASPEQIRGEAITTATDVYGLGVLLYEVLTGDRPFRTENLSPAEAERLICESAPDRPSTRSRLEHKSSAESTVESISGDLDNIVLKAMHKEPSRRYTSAAELSSDLGRYLEGFPVAARPDSWRYRTRKFISRHKVATVAAALFTLTITGLSAGLAVQATRATREAQTAEREARTADQISRFLGSLFENARPDETQGRSTSARDILDRGADRVSRELSGQPLVEARLLDTLGSTYYRLGAVDRAEALLSRAYEIQTRFLGDHSDEAAESLYVLAEVATDKADFNRAAKDYGKILEVYGKIKGRNDDRAAEIKTDLATVQYRLGDLDGAKERYREVAAYWSRVKGPTAPRTLFAKNGLEVALADMGDYNEAETLAREILAARLKILGSNHPDVADSLHNLAWVLGRKARLREAEALARQAVDLQRKLFGPEHPHVAISLELLSDFDRRLGRLDDAETLGKEALAMAVKLYGPHSPDASENRCVLGLTMLAKGDFGAARDLLEQSLAARITRGKRDYPTLGDSYDGVGLLDLRTKHLADARRNIELGLASREGFYGRTNDRVATSLDRLGQVLTAEGDYAGAEQRYRQAIAIARTKFQGAHTLTAQGLFDLGDLLMRQGRLAEARAPLTQSLEMRRALLPSGHPDIAASAAAFAKCESLTAQKSK